MNNAAAGEGRGFGHDHAPGEGMNRDVRTINATDEASTRTRQGTWRGSGGIDEPVAVVGMGAQDDGERALAAHRVAMAGGSEQVTQGEREGKK